MVVAIVREFGTYVTATVVAVIVDENHDQAVVACASGARAALAASVLRRRGHELVSRVAGGVPELVRNGVSLVTAAL